jgi:hypothetical protein
MNTKALPDPRQKPVDRIHQRQDGQHVSSNDKRQLTACGHAREEVVVQNLTGHDQTECCTLAESVQGVCGAPLLVLCAAVDDHTTARDRFIHFWNAQFADCD